MPLVAFLSIEMIQRRRFSDLDLELEKTLEAFRLKSSEIPDKILAPGTVPVVGSFYLQPNFDNERLRSWQFICKPIPETKSLMTAFGIELRQRRSVILGSPRVRVQWMRSAHPSLKYLLKEVLESRSIDYDEQ